MTSEPDLSIGQVAVATGLSVRGARTPALAADLIHAAQFDQGGRDLLRTAEPDGTCSYTFSEATGFAP